MSTLSSLQPTTGNRDHQARYGLFFLFTYLQLLDALTTLACLASGVREANPVVRAALAFAPSHAVALAALKAAAVAGAWYCLRTGRLRLLSRASVFFAALVVWNLAALLAKIA
jgi:hypothetical protein